MRLTHSFFAAVLAIVIAFPPNTYSYWVWSPTEGKFMTQEEYERPRQPPQTAEEIYKSALALKEQGKLDQVTGALRNLVRTYPLSPQAPEAQYLIATIYADVGKTDRAVKAYQKLVRDFPQSDKVDRSVQSLFEIGMGYLSGEKQKVLGMAVIPSLPKAANIFKFIVESAPYGAYGDQAQYHLGAAYRKMGRFQEAVDAFQKVVDDYPYSALIDDTHYQLAETSFQLSQNVNRDQQSLELASGNLQNFIKTHAASTLAERAALLKRELDEQDAEKNYRIGFYYEKQGFMESATIYYDDVARHYPETAFGKKAAERLRVLTQPEKMVAQGREVVERRLAEVDSMLEALMKKEQEKDLAPEIVSENAAMRSELDSERASLKIAVTRFEQSTQKDFKSRFDAFKAREKNLRAKIKTFNRRSRALERDASVSLTQVLESWRESLLKEEREIDEERARLALLRPEAVTKRHYLTGWIPRFRGRAPELGEEPSFKGKKWERLVLERARIASEREPYEGKINALGQELAQLERQELEFVRALPVFESMLEEPLKNRMAAHQAKAAELQTSAKSFQQAKDGYQSVYGENALRALGLDRKPADLSFLNGNEDLQQALAALQQEKAGLSRQWLLQKGNVAAIAKAVEHAQGSPSVTVAPEQAANIQEQRVLKKKMKFLERQIRERLDQIQDWERENEIRTQELDQLLDSKEEVSSVEKLGAAVTRPATGFYKLTKAFLFGLPNKNAELAREAKETLETGDGRTHQELERIRALQEEIELQGILIQGRAREVTEMKAELDQLRARSKDFLDFEYQSMLVDRFPSALENSLAGAASIFEGEDTRQIFEARLRAEQEKLTGLTSRLAEIDQKIDAVAGELERIQQMTIQSQKAQTIADITGVESTRTADDEGDEAATAEAERLQMESELQRMKAELDQTELAHQKEARQIDQDLLGWYRAAPEARQELRSSLGEEGKRIAERVETVRSERAGLLGPWSSAVRKEIEVIEAQLAIEPMAQGRDQLAHDLAVLQSSLQQNLS